MSTAESSARVAVGCEEEERKAAVIQTKSLPAKTDQEGGLDSQRKHTSAEDLIQVEEEESKIECKPQVQIGNQAQKLTSRSSFHLSEGVYELNLDDFQDIEYFEDEEESKEDENEDF